MTPTTMSTMAAIFMAVRQPTIGSGSPDAELPMVEAVMGEMTMKGTLERAFWYQGNAMALPVPDVDAAIPFYENVLGFRVASRGDTPHKSVVLARDEVQMALAENGGDPTQDGCAFHVRHLDALFTEFKANGLEKSEPDFGVERRGDT